MKKLILSGMICCGFIILGLSYAQAVMEEGAFPDVSAFLNMPYKQVVVGIPWQLSEATADEEEKLPFLADGQIALFSRGPSGSVSQLRTGNEADFDMQQPQKSTIFACINERSGIQFSIKNTSLQSCIQGGGIRLAKAEVDLSRVSGSSGLEARHNVAVLQEDKQSGALITSSILKHGNEDTKKGSLTTSADVKKASSHSDSGHEYTVSRNKETAESSARGGDYSVSSEKQMRMAAEKNGMLSKLMSLLISRIKKQGGLEFLKDYDELTATYGDYFIKALLENGGFLVGVSDEGMTEALVDGRYAPTIEEQKAFEDLVRHNVNLKDLVYRPFSQTFVKPGSDSALGQARIKTSYDLLPRPMYHGAVKALVITVTNTGKVPIYDMLAAFSVPKHTSFLRFIDEQPSSKGFLNLYFPERNLMAIKVYRPLQPGQTFKEIVLLTLDKWPVMARR